MGSNHVQPRETYPFCFPDMDARRPRYSQGGFLVAPPNHRAVDLNFGSRSHAASVTQFWLFNMGTLESSVVGRDKVIALLYDAEPARC